MSALEEEIIAKFNLLDAKAQSRVLAILQHHVQQENVPLKAWLADAVALSKELARKIGTAPDFSVQETLDDIRDEESRWPRP